MLVNSLRDEHNFSHHTNSIIVWIFIQNIFFFSACLPPRRLVSKLWSLSRHDSVSGYKQILCLADNPQRVDNIRRAICFAYSCISSVQLLSKIQLFCIFCSLLPRELFLRFQSNIQFNRWYVTHIFQIIMVSFSWLLRSRRRVGGNQKRRNILNEVYHHL